MKTALGKLNAVVEAGLSMLKVLADLLMSPDFARFQLLESQSRLLSCFITFLHRMRLAQLQTELIKTNLRLFIVVGVVFILVLIAKPILVCLMANAHYKTQTYRPTDNA